MVHKTLTPLGFIGIGILSGIQAGLVLAMALTGTPDCQEVLDSLEGEDHTAYLSMPGAYYDLEPLGRVRMTHWKSVAPAECICEGAEESLEGKLKDSVKFWYHYQTEDGSKLAVPMDWWMGRVSCTDKQDF